MLPVEAVHTGGQHLYTLEVARLAFEFSGLGLGHLVFQLLQLMFERLLTQEELFDVLGELGFGSADDARDAGELRLGFLKAPQRAFTGDRLDAADARRNRAFVDDLADSDVAGAGHVRASAQLLAEAVDRDHAHALAVFFAEQRHRSGGKRLVEVHDVGVDFAVDEDLLVHEPLDFGELVGIHGRIVSEIEAQARGLNHAAGLLDMRAEDGAQGGMKQVRAGVIAHNGAARVGVHAS